VSEEAELKSYQITINGKLFAVASPRGESHIREVEAFLGEKVAEVHSSFDQAAPTNNLAILVALNITDELLDLRKERRAEKFSLTQMEKNLRSLCLQLEQALPTNASSEKEPE